MVKRNQSAWSIEDSARTRIRLSKEPQPYEQLFDGQKSPRAKRKDLRRLSEQIKAQRRVAISKSSKPSLLFLPLGILVTVVAGTWRKLIRK